MGRVVNRDDVWRERVTATMEQPWTEIFRGIRMLPIEKGLKISLHILPLQDQRR